MSIQTTLMTVEELRRLPEPTDGTSYELHHGELVRVTIPKFWHHKRAERIAEALRSQLARPNRIYVECPFRALPEHDARRADVAFLTAEQEARADLEGEVFGAPEVVIEVLSPSNTKAEMADREALCFSNGCREFWVVNRIRRTVKVTKPNEEVRWYSAGDSIPLDAFGGSEIAVDRLFD